MKKDVGEQIENNIEQVINKWNEIGTNSFDIFSKSYKNLGEMELCRVTKAFDNIERNNTRDFSFTCEPKDEKLEEFNLVLRHVLYERESENGLYSNKTGIVFGKFDLNDFDGL
ncbi:hypothetical protein [Virgibacillus sp. DJP39]|uniref:hypothetical protein n=1 Tax=Virgibacillus sp. DJP39 TaxID=3409790 RepID=UPI003BB65D5C